MVGKEVITLKQVLATMADTAEPFSLRFVKLNEGKDTGGELVEVSGMLQSGRGAGPADVTDIDVGQSTAPALQKVHRAPNHFDNMTRNLMSTVNGSFCKVHIYLITAFNGKLVII